jgi:hypothetical protein
MKTSEEPADTRMMGIVHAALRRDLLRARKVVSAKPYPVGRQRRALGEHVVWMMDFLHAHHTSEDIGLWPLVRERNPADECTARLARGGAPHHQPSRGDVD